jgi:site-specific recombinase XerD
MKLSEALVEYALACRAQNLSEHTLRWYEQKLGVFRNFLTAEGIDSLADLRPASIHRFTAYLQTTPSLNGRGVRSTYTVKGYVEVVKNFLSWAEQEDLIDEKVRKRVPNPKVEQKVIRVLSREQFQRLMAASDLEPTRTLQLRDRALLCMLLATGLRASELCGLRVCDLDIGGDFIRVRGKGKKQREIGPMGQTSLKHLRRYLRGVEERNPEAAVFVSRRTGGALTPDGIDQLIKRLRDHAGEEFFAGIRVSAHTFRHTFAVNFLKQGGNIKQLQLLLGHTSLAVTQRYLEDFQARDARRGQSVLDNL